jgi:hypothetical protein
MDNYTVSIKYQSSFNNDYYLNNYLKTGIIDKIYPDDQSKNEENSKNYNKIMNYLNIYNYLNYNKNFNTSELFLNQVDNYFTSFFESDNLDYKTKLITYLYEIQTLWFYSEIKNKKWSTYFNIFMKNLVQYYLNKCNYCFPNYKYKKYLNITELFIDLLTSDISNENENENKYVNKKIIDGLNQNIIMSMLDDCSSYNQNFNIFDLKSLTKLGLKQESQLINLVNIKEKLKYQHTSNIVSFDKNTIIERMKKMSNGLINDNFPFDSESFMISGGFAVNSIIDIVSDYTDIDIYIFQDFEYTANKLIDYFTSICPDNIKMTNNSSIINIYPINYNMNIQLIKIYGNPHNIINQFDLSYTQIAILDWDNIIMTNKAVKSLITGYFTLNRNNVIRSYRIIKAYVKGFVLDPKEFHQVFIDDNQNKFIYKLLDEVKDIVKNLYQIYIKFNKNIVYNFNNINNLNNLDNDLSHGHISDIEFLLMNYLNDELVNKLMTKSITLTNETINKYLSTQNYDLFKGYLESLTLCDYFEKKDLYNINFKNLEQYHINYEQKELSTLISKNNCSKNVLKEIMNYYYPDPKNISICIPRLDNPKEFPISVKTGYYDSVERYLSCYSLYLNINIKDFKLINKKGHLTFSIELNDNKSKNIINNIDSKLEDFYKKLIYMDNFKSQKSLFLKKLYKNDEINVNITFEDFVNKLILKNDKLEHNKISNIKKFSKYCIHQIKNTKFKTLSDLTLLNKYDLIKSDNIIIQLKLSNLIAEEQTNTNGEKILVYKYNINIHDICFIE